MRCDGRGVQRTKLWFSGEISVKWIVSRSVRRRRLLVTTRRMSVSFKLLIKEKKLKVLRCFILRVT